MIPFLDLSRRHARLATETEAAIVAVARRGSYILGPAVEEFERAFAQHLGGGFVVGVASGTDALTLGLMALGIGPGDEVVTPANTCMPTVSGIRATGAAVQLADCDRQSRLLEVQCLEGTITARTKAVVAVHLYGHPCDGPALAELCNRRGIALVEDCAQAHGTQFRQRSAGTWGRVAAFSFYPTKTLGAYGDAGGVFTQDAAVAERLRELRMYGYKTRDCSVREGRNSRLDEIQAAVLGVHLKHVPAWVARRRAIAGYYREAFASTPTIGLPWEREDSQNAYHLFVITVEDRSTVRERLSTLGIQTAIHYPVAVHQHPVYMGRSWGPLRNAEWLSGHVLSLPCFPELTDDEVTRVSEAVLEVLR
jgi:dTDP-4-amino-4,6-dideoxygalactose transaminase